MDEYVFLAVLLGVALVLFWTQRIGPDLTAFLVLLALILPWPHADGEWRAVLTVEEGFAGFGSSAVIMVACMFVIGAAIVRTGAAEWLGMRLFQACSSEWQLQLAVLGVSTLASMFVNDTTVVLVLLPLIMAVCKEKSVSPSRYLIFAAYGSLLGGQWTLTGTRSNLIISDYLRLHTGSGFGFFDLTPIGAAVFAASALYLLTIGRRFLPSKDTPSELRTHREYLTEVTVLATSSAIGSTVDELEAATGSDLNVLEALRDGKRLVRWGALREDDELVIKGNVDAIGRILKSSEFEVRQQSEMDAQTLQRVDLITVEAFVTKDSRYVGTTLDSIDFRRVHGFTVVGMAHRGRRLRENLMAARLSIGDSLLLLGNQEDLERLESNPNLVVLGKEPFAAIGKRKALIVTVLLASIVFGAISGFLAPPISIPLAAACAVLLGCVHIRDAYDAIDLRSLLTVAGMIPFATALEKSGAAHGLAEAMVEALHQHGPYPLLGGILLVAVISTQVIENAAVAIILAPLAFNVAQTTGVDPKPFLVGLGVCVSAAFCTPFAHESTLLVMQPGRYEFKHYLRLGVFLAVLTWGLATWLTPLVWRFSTPA